MKTLWLAVSVLMALSLVAAACGPAAAPAPPKPPTPQAASVPSAPQAPAPPATPPPQGAPVTDKPQAGPASSGADTVKVTLTRLDGTKMEKTVEKPKYGGTLNRRQALLGRWDPKILTASDVSYLLPLEKLLEGDFSRGTEGTGEISWQIYEYLSMSHFRGALAESWELPDDQTVIYHIRHGVHWALDSREASRIVGGREVTADDVIFSFKFLVLSEPATAVRGYFATSKLTSVTAPDKYTVVIKAPKTDLANALGYISDLVPIVPHEVIEKYGTFTGWQQVVGTGAFMIQDYVPGSVTTWVKNPNYWDSDPVLGKDYRLPYVDSIKYFDIPDSSTAQAAFRTGKLDATLNLTRDDWKQMLNTAPNLKTKTVQFGTASNRIAFQMNSKSAPWQDVRVRQALSMGINHQEILDTFYGGAADMTAFPLPGAPELYALGWVVPQKDLPRETQELFEYHPDKAKQLLKEAGYPTGFKTTITLDRAVAEWLDLASIIKDYWARIGVDLTLDVRDTGVFNNLIRGAYPDMINTSRWGTATLYSKFETPPNSNNEGNVDDKRIQDLRRQMFDVFWDTPKRTPIMKELYTYSLSQAYYLPIPAPWSYKVYQPWVKNFDAEASIGYWGQPWQYVWLDRDLKKKLGF